MKTFLFLDAGKAIKCLICDKVSYHPDDVANRYCGFCHEFHDHREELLEIAAKHGFRGKIE